jgi:uncharacterized protein (TIGR00369 family)
MMFDSLDAVHDAQKDRLPDWFGLQWSRVVPGHVQGRLVIEPHHLAPHEFLHGASIVALADTACGFGCLQSLPEGAINFTTAELKTNFVGTAREGAIACEARLVHGGRTTQVWDAEVSVEATGKAIALFRCTQILLYPKTT